ncbi:hypothetical protein NQZ79_g3649 [Umbelopsis isabellina]|nr:hypothetical protein NQZ79_g3649 [Umbelopsis isabellina]
MASEVAECSICMEALAGAPLAALPWSASVPKCPVCNRKTKRTEVFGPLFFTIPDTAGGKPHQSTTLVTTGETEDTMDLSYAVDLKTNFEKAHRNLEEKSVELQRAQQQLERLKSQNIQLQTEHIRLQEVNSRHQHQLRYIKQLKGVQELDAAVQSPSAQARMRQWKELPRDQLALVLGTLHEKVTILEGEKAQWKRKDKMQQEELHIFRTSLDKSENKRKKMVEKKQDLEKEIRRLKQQSTSNNGDEATSATIASSSLGKRRIMSDDETDINETDDESITVPKKTKPEPIELSSDSDTDNGEEYIPIVSRNRSVHPKRLELLGLPPQHEATI